MLGRTKITDECWDNTRPNTSFYATSANYDLQKKLCVETHPVVNRLELFFACLEDIWQIIMWLVQCFLLLFITSKMLVMNSWLFTFKWYIDAGSRLFHQSDFNFRDAINKFNGFFESEMRRQLSPTYAFRNSALNPSISVNNKWLLVMNSSCLVKFTLHELNDIK